MTNDATKCPYYQAESENVKGRWACVVPQDVMRQEAVHGLTIPNNEEQCLVCLHFLHLHLFLCATRSVSAKSGVQEETDISSSGIHCDVNSHK